MNVKVTWRKGGLVGEKRIKAIGFLLEDKQQIPSSTFFKELIKALRTQVPSLFPGETVTMLWSQTTIHGDSQGVVTRRKVSTFTVQSGGTWACESLVSYTPETNFVEVKIHCASLSAASF